MDQRTAFSANLLINRDRYPPISKHAISTVCGLSLVSIVVSLKTFAHVASNPYPMWKEHVPHSFRIPSPLAPNIRACCSSTYVRKCPRLMQPRGIFAIMLSLEFGSTCFVNSRQGCSDIRRIGLVDLRVEGVVDWSERWRFCEYLAITEGCRWNVGCRLA